uniref:calpain-9-like n=1 Tax=Maylandia zebra TaxID=106582 RepID=UPI000D300F11|nr:calpain-9-like [Maylandia zebra]
MFFNTHLPVARSDKYMNAREVIEFLMLKPGEYLIVPSTFKSNETASFILTIHSREETCCYENSNSNEQRYEPVEKVTKVKNHQDEENKKTFFRQYSDKYEEVDAEQLQRLLNENILKGMKVSDDMLSLMALRYGASSGHTALECFINLMIRLDCMKSK